MHKIVWMLAAASLATAAHADATKKSDDAKAVPANVAPAAPIMVSFGDLKWSSLPERPMMQYSVLSGDPKTGPYRQLRKVPAGTHNVLHAHSSELTNVIISGVWYTGADSATARDFGPGSVVMMPGDWVHVSGCRPGADCVFYQEGKGKFDFKPKAAAHSEQMPGK